MATIQQFIEGLMRSGEATAEEARLRRASRWDEPAPVPAQMLGGMAQSAIDPFIHFNEPGRDPVQQGVDLGLAGLPLAAFGRTIPHGAPPRELPPESWGAAQRGDIQAIGELTGQQWQRDLAELQGPVMPEPALREWEVSHGGPGGGGSLRPNYDPGELNKLFDFDRYGYGRGRDAYGFPEPFTNEVHGDMVWDALNGRWKKKTPKSNDFSFDPDEPLPHTLGEVDEGMFGPEDALREFREGMDYMPPEGSGVPPRSITDLSPEELEELGRKIEESQISFNPDDPIYQQTPVPPGHEEGGSPPPELPELPEGYQIGPTWFEENMPPESAFARVQPRVSYEEWARMMNAFGERPLPPRINPFAAP